MKDPNTEVRIIDPAWGARAGKIAQHLRPLTPTREPSRKLKARGKANAFLPGNDQLHLIPSVTASAISPTGRDNRQNR